jgi:hypothetical protein
MRNVRRRRVMLGRCSTRMSCRRIETAAEMVQRSLQLLAACSEAERRLVQAHPTDAERYEVVVDALAALVAREIAELRKEEP